MCLESQLKNVGRNAAVKGSFEREDGISNVEFSGKVLTPPVFFSLSKGIIGQRAISGAQVDRPSHMQSCVYFLHIMTKHWLVYYKDRWREGRKFEHSTVFSVWAGTLN